MYALCTSPCAGCGRLFSYNPVRVPSIRIKGTREPICRVCIDRVNPTREANGLPPIAPAADAYEPVDEGELSWD
jgi:hypothetical protein